MSFYKLFLVKDTYVYAKVRVSQGLWWANTQRPPAWFIPALLKIKQEANNVSGELPVRVMALTYYPYYTTSQYDIYLNLKLRVNGNHNSGVYSFNRATLAVGAPIELSFPGIEFTGTVLALSERPLRQRQVTKTLTLVKNNGFQWEYDAIELGDRYFDGQKNVFEVIDKQVSDNPTYDLDYIGSFGERSIVNPNLEPRKTIMVKLRVKALKSNGQYFYAEEQELKIGKTLNFSSNKFVFQDFQLAAID